MKGILIGVDIYLITNLIFFVVCIAKGGSHLSESMTKEFEKLSKSQRIVAELMFVLVMSVILLPATLAVMISKGGKR